MAKISVMSVMMINGHRSYYGDGNEGKHSNKDAIVTKGKSYRQRLRIRFLAMSET